MQREKVRIYALARELNIETKDLLDLCRQAGIDVKNQLSSVDAEQRDAVESLVRRGNMSAVAVASPPPKPVSVLPNLSKDVPLLPTRQTRREADGLRVVPPPASTPVPTLAAEAPRPAVAPAAKAAEVPAVKVPEPVAAKTLEVSAARAPEQTAPPPDLAAKTPGTGKVRDLGQARPEGGARPKRARDIPRPLVARVAQPPPLKPPPAKKKEGEKKPEPIAQKPIARLPEGLRGGAVSPQDLVNKLAVGDVPVAPVDEEEEGEGAEKGKVRPGGVAGRDRRHQERQNRARLRKGRQEDEVRGTRVLLPVDEDRPQRVKDRIKRAQQKQRLPTAPRKGRVPVEMPITVRKLSEAVGVPVGKLLFSLQDHGAPPTTNINSTVDPVMAETVALDSGCELEIKRPPDAEERLLAELQKPDDPEDLAQRAPIVTVMGHVDHGKTSLLDKIRQSNIVATETGGITQVIRAWRVDHNGRPVTFLDTPGHEAFTQMRARGANVTDIAVIVVAADDGVMPQTEEAINHAKAAGVSIVVAVNKVDLPSANVTKTRQQLYGLGLIPDNMGGEVPFVETSAATGKGIDDLLDNLSVVAELQELKANPQKPARGTCLEAMLSEGEGVLATLLVQDGTLHRGEVVVCGATYGRVRAMYDDLGRPIQEAGPSVPIRITGLDAVPNASDLFLNVPDLSVAREIAEKRRARQLEASMFKREPARLEKLSEAKIAELKVILKADFRGSIEAIRKELEKLHHAEVRVRVLHAAIGAISESDVHLALTSPEDTIIVGFNVVPDDRANALAEERGVQIREYDIIYNLTDDIRSALEGKLKPHEQVIHLGRAVVRETFKISRVGTVAGCYLTQGTIERSAKVRVIRQGVVIYPPSDRSASLESLKRFKEDVREVREGFECGLKIAGYDDIKVDDVIEAYRIEQVQRTL